ncbi:Calx-beta domain protein [compost metagenome]
MKRITTLLSLALLFSTNSQAQLTITTGQPVANYVNNNLIGQGVTVSNITFTGDPGQIGSFDGSSTTLGFASGLVISTGGVNGLVPGGFGTEVYLNPGDPDLVPVAQSVSTNPSAGGISESHDAGILEFDFVPQSDLVTFRFIFASDEYLAFVQSQWNDAFGFFVSGPGITGPYSSPAGFPDGAQNYAVVPGTNLPITISTIYPPGLQNPPYYIADADPNGYNSEFYVDNPLNQGIQMNGYTIPMQVTLNVQCGETYHFKFSVADIEDWSYSTAVLLEAGSFTSPPINLSLSNSNSIGGTNEIIEACSDARFMLTRSACQSGSTLTVNFATGGSATYGADYTITQPSPLVFPAGTDTMYLDLVTIADAIAEGTETITIDIDYIDQFGNPQTSTATFLLTDITPLGINETDLSLACLSGPITLNAPGTGGSGIYDYDWEGSNSTTSQNVVTINQNGTYNYVVSITDECLGIYTDTVTVVMNQTLAIDTMITYTASACTPDGAVSGSGSGITTPVNYHWEGPNTGGPITVDASVLQNIGPGWYVFTITDNVCTVTDSVFLSSEPGPIAEFTPSSIAGCNPLTVTFTNTSQNATNFEWNFGNGNTATIDNLSSQTQTYTASANQFLVAINGPCRDTAFTSIAITECGCTDPLATNFNPQAVQNDGSCLYPEPIVIVPNIFTPNGDKNNDVFILTTTNATELKMTITNRWGNVVFEGSGLNAFWDGKINGSVAPDGVYFLRYTAKGLLDKEINGQGFLQLINQ